MKKTIPLLAILMAELCLAAPLVAATARTATENFVTNKIAAAISQIPPPDFSTNNVALVATIEATAPAPGNYAAVSNAAVHAAITNALQDTAIAEKQDKLPYATNAIPYAAISGKPTINGETLNGNKTANDFGLVDQDNIGGYLSEYADIFKIAPEFSRTTSYGVDELVSYMGPQDEAYGLYRCITNHVGTWNAQHFRAATVEEMLKALRAAPGNYAAVSNAAMNALSRYEAEAGFTEWVVTPSEYDGKSLHIEWVRYEFDGLIFQGWAIVDSDGEERASRKDYPTATNIVWSAYDTSIGAASATRTRLPTMADIPTAQINAATTTNALQDTAIESNRVSIASHADSISTLSDSISTLSNSTSTVSSGLAQLADEAAPAINGYARLYSFITGSTNANFVVTNYQLTAEAEAARTHFDPSDPDLDFSTVPPSLRLEDASSGTNRVVVDTRDWVVWYYAQKIGGAMAEAVSTAVDTCRAWCGFTASGLENPAPDTLVVDVPNIWLMAGKTFEKHIAGSNAVWIIRSSGVVMPISDNSQSAGGFLELTDAFGTPYIRFKKTESYFVDPAADGVEYDSATGAWLVTYTTTTCPKGGANAVLEGSTTYPGKAILKDEDDPDCPATITWTGSANNWVMHAVPKQIDGAVPPKMFFAAVVEVQGQDYIEYLRPMSVPSLMFNGATYAPTVNGNKLEFIAQ